MVHPQDTTEGCSNLKFCPYQVLERPQNYLPQKDAAEKRGGLPAAASHNTMYRHRMASVTASPPRTTLGP